MSTIPLESGLTSCGTKWPAAFIIRLCSKNWEVKGLAMSGGTHTHIYTAVHGSTQRIESGDVLPCEHASSVSTAINQVASYDSNGCYIAMMASTQVWTHIPSLAIPMYFQVCGSSSPKSRQQLPRHRWNFPNLRSSLPKQLNRYKTSSSRPQCPTIHSVLYYSLMFLLQSAVTTKAQKHNMPDQLQRAAPGYLSLYLKEII